MNWFAPSLRIAIAQASTLAQRGGDPSQATVRILVLLGVMVALALMMLVVAVWVRKWLVRSQNEDAVNTGFTLHEMRRLHQEGELSDEEYEAARTALLARSRHALSQSSPDSTAAPADNATDDDSERPTNGPT